MNSPSYVFFIIIKFFMSFKLDLKIIRRTFDSQKEHKIVITNLLLKFKNLEELLIKFKSVIKSIDYLKFHEPLSLNYRCHFLTPIVNSIFILRSKYTLELFFLFTFQAFKTNKNTKNQIYTNSKILLMEINNIRKHIKKVLGFASLY